MANEEKEVPTPAKQPTEEKSRLHPNNKHRSRYDLKALVKTTPELAPFVILNKYKNESIDFANPDAVKALNKALLQHHYGIEHWNIPEGYLCPPIPGRADYIHHIADWLRANNYGAIPAGEKIKVYDIGVGANCIYPIIGHKEYQWQFIGSEIDPVAMKAAQTTINKNPGLKDAIELRLQKSGKDYFYHVLKRGEKVDLTICNPPYHESAEAAQAASLRKQNNLGKKKVSKSTLNFGGKNNELWCEGGEKKFVRGMIQESKKFGPSCAWFSCLISKQTHLKSVIQALHEAKVEKFETIPMGQGNKTSRIVVWTFLDKEAQKIWKNTRWNEKKTAPTELNVTFKEEEEGEETGE